MLPAEIEATELQESTVVREAAQIAGFRQECERENRADAGQRVEPLMVWMGAEHLIRLLLNRCPSGTELLMFRQDHTEHLDRYGVLRYRETHTL